MRAALRRARHRQRGSENSSKIPDDLSLSSTDTIIRSPALNAPSSQPTLVCRIQEAHDVVDRQLLIREPSSRQTESTVVSCTVHSLREPRIEFVKLGTREGGMSRACLLPA